MEEWTKVLSQSNSLQGAPPTPPTPCSDPFLCSSHRVTRWSPHYTALLTLHSLQGTAWPWEQSQKCIMPPSAFRNESSSEESPHSIHRDKDLVGSQHVHVGRLILGVLHPHRQGVYKPLYMGFLLCWNCLRHCNWRDLGSSSHSSIYYAYDSRWAILPLCVSIPCFVIRCKKFHLTELLSYWIKVRVQNSRQKSWYTVKVSDISLRVWVSVLSWTSHLRHVSFVLYSNPSCEFLPIISLHSWIFPFHPACLPLFLLWAKPHIDIYRIS